MQSIVLFQLLLTGTLTMILSIKASQDLIPERSINCKVTGSECPINKTCMFSCKYPCLKEQDPIYGTTIYSSNSAICKSALHDLRISLDTHARNIIVKAYEKDDCFLESSVRFGFTSYSSQNESSSVFEFISPRISEEILDTASIHSNYLYNQGENHVQACVIASNALSKTQNVHLKIYSDWKSYAKEHLSEIPDRNSIRFTQVWTKTTESTAFGFQCVPSETTLSIVTSIAFRKDANFLPMSITLIANKNENVTLTMNETEKTDNETLWKKDYGDENYFSPNVEVKRTELKLFNVNEASSGIYSLGYEDSLDRFGFMQLIVRSCPEGKYGVNCTNRCETCLNGGICHDITGECICAPGFNGSKCGEACKPGYLGKMCSIKCRVKGKEMEGCKGLLVCLPRPYGCSCASGYTGLQCNKTCPEGYYGAECKQQHTYSHPKLGNCSVFYNYCPCSSGWHGTNCNESYPVLNNAPTLLNVLKNSISVSFSEWSSSSDFGSGVPAYYEVIYKESGQKSWINAHHILTGMENQMHVVNFTNLKPATQYAIGVVVVDKSSNKQVKDVKFLNVNTSCDIPSSPPSNIRLSVVNQNIFVEWNAPPQEDWNCWKIDTVIKLKEVSSNVTSDYRTNVSPFSFPSHPFITWLIEVCVSPVDGEINDTNCADPQNITSAGSPLPSPVELKVVKRPTSLSFTWIPPPKLSGMIDHYVIIYRDTDTDISYTATVQTKDAICKEEKGYYNCYTIKDLLAGHLYEIKISAIKRNTNEEIVIKSLTVKLEYNSDPVAAILGVFIPIIFTIAVIVFVLYMQRRRKKSSLKVKFLPYKVENEFAASNEGLVDLDIIDTESMCDEISNRISIRDLPEYVKENVKNGNIRKEIMSVPAGQIYPCTISKLGENKPKNRYGNILPYDHSRVVLDIINEDPFSHYIHANYVHGYEKVKKYIATQGPLYATVRDFWRMVWNEGSCKILMITNFVENGRIKCEKYWSEDTVTYGDITICLQNSESYADFSIRTFTVSKNKVSRELRQFHYITWPDHGAPNNPTPFINYLKKARSYQPDIEAPIIVHCSAGIGRTGSVILLDSMIDMGLREKHVDLVNHLCSMRKQRMNCVENYDQYVFVYYALVEVLCFEVPAIKLPNFIRKYEKLQAFDDASQMTSIEKEFEILKTLATDLRYEDMKDAYLEENQNKNRSMKILPPDQARPFLPRNSTDSIYINAVYIDSYSRRDSYIATQYPLPETINDFWEMIYLLKLKTVVLLQEMDFSNEYIPQIYTSEGQQRYGDYQVECLSAAEEKHFKLITLSISVNNSETKDPLSINLIALKEWPLNNNLPTEATVVLSAISKVFALQSELNHHAITTVCLDGVTACGIFCAMLYICDQIKREQEVDVFYAVKCIRTNRPQFILDVDQYTFLYKLIQQYLESM